MVDTIPHDTSLHRMVRITALATAGALLVAATALWSMKANAVVTEPYLDEFFHVRQAQAYCEGKFSHWDPKITTPPGLYWISAALQRLSFIRDCSLTQLRLLNSTLPVVLLLLGLDFSNTIDVQASPSQYTTHDVARAIVRSVHTQLNICLFPPLFFFTGLYYTDVFSTTSVLFTFWLRQNKSLSHRLFLRSNLLFLNGLVALSFRQTNIFWVAIFPAILDVVDVVKKNARSAYRQRSDDPSTVSERNTKLDYQFISASWRRQVLYDVPFNDFFGEVSPVHFGKWLNVVIPTDYIKVPLSIAVGAVANLPQVMQVLVPYLTLVGAFTTFVLLNGGVVLGDKSNHVATLHLPQLLYIWPLITFFSLPLMYPHIMASILPCAALPRHLQVYQPKYPKAESISRFPKATRRRIIVFTRMVFAIVMTGIALLVIRYNTIVHPFTLADNRHYVFYVFRLLLRNSRTKYVVAPVYILCAWATFQTLCKPCAPPFHRSRTLGMNYAVRIWEHWWNAEEVEYWQDDRLIPYAPDGCMTSYVLAWFATTALTLITAPLVEPRYFILPWIFWRLRVPGPRIETLDDRLASVEPSVDLERKDRESTARYLVRMNRSGKSRRDRAIERIRSQYTEASNSRPIGLVSLINHGDHRLWLETAWLLLINAVTGWMFLYRGFSWPQEPGKIQRFMW